MAIVQRRDALHKEKFYFTKTLFPVEKASLAPSAHYRECELMDANTIFNGKVPSCLIINCHLTVGVS